MAAAKSMADMLLIAFTYVFGVVVVVAAVGTAIFVCLGVCGLIRSTVANMQAEIDAESLLFV